jgi:hypothetical protein
MSDNEQEIIALFIAVDDKLNVMRIVVSQVSITDNLGGTTFLKKFYLNEINGQKVYQTKDPDIFKLFDGTILKKGHRREIADG